MSTMLVNEELVQRQQARKARMEADQQGAAAERQETRDQTPERQVAADQTPAVEKNPSPQPPKAEGLDKQAMAYVKAYGPWAIVAVLTVLIVFGRIQGSPQQQAHLVKKNGVYHLEEFGIVVSPNGKILATPDGQVSRGWFSGRPLDDSVVRFTAEQYAAGKAVIETAPGQLRIFRQGQDGGWYVKTYQLK